MSLRIKICGITNTDDALAAVDAGADALGFVFYQESARRIAAAEAAKITWVLPPFVARVGVFVNPTEELVKSAIDAGLDTLQFHGEEGPDFCQKFRLKTIKAFRIRDQKTLRDMPSYTTDAWLLDSYVSGKPGGTGETFNWDLVTEAKRLGRPIILAGGLTVRNVAEAIQRVRPYGVDVSSGVEANPGKKDFALLREFISAARDADSPRSAPRE